MKTPSAKVRSFSSVSPAVASSDGSARLAMPSRQKKTLGAPLIQSLPAAGRAARPSTPAWCHLRRHVANRSRSGLIIREAQTVHARRAAIDNALLRDGAATGLEVWVAVRQPELLPVVRNELQHRRNTNGAHLGMVAHET
jgi:hypothetical protein